jgi:hypothetical protein
MAQHDYVIDNQSAPAARTDMNNALQAILTQNSGATAPSTTVANMIWYDTSTDLLKMRNEANSGWITVGTVNQSTSNFESATVNGKTIGTLTSAGGIAYATSTSALAAIGAGTSGQVLQSNAAAAPSWVTPTAGGITLLGTLTTTSGTTQTLSGLTLTPYKFVYVNYYSVSSSSSVSSSLQIQGNSGSSVNISVFTGGAAGQVLGDVRIDLVNGYGIYNSVLSSTSGDMNTILTITSVTTATTSINFKFNNVVNFDLGTIRIYGVQ